LSKIFKEFSETNFLDYLITIRMEKAKELLSDSNKKVYEIARKIGYTNTQSFIRIFKKYTGKTPNEYRSDGALDSADPALHTI
jgi:two-component system response regulator YesN